MLLAVGIEAAGVHRVVDPKVKNARFAAESGHLSSLGRQGSNVAVKRVRRDPFRDSSDAVTEWPYSCQTKPQ